MNAKFTGSCFLYIYRLIEEPKYELDNLNRYKSVPFVMKIHIRISLKF